MKHRPFNLTKYCHPLVLLTLFLLVTGCTHAAYREPITRFQLASTVVIEGTRAAYAEANKGKRNAEIDRRLKRREPITLDYLDSKDLRLLTPDDIAKRMKLLAALSKHGELLLTLASSDAPQKAKDAANSLNDALVSFSKAVDASKFTANAGGFVAIAGGFVAIAGEIVRYVHEAKITSALDKAIVASNDQVKSLLRLLQSEMDAFYQLRRKNLSKERVAAVDSYNKLINQLKKQADIDIEQPNPQQADIEKAVARIKSVEDAWDDLPLLGYGPGLDAMSQAHKNLVDYASSSKTPQDFDSMVEAIDAFVTRAKVIAEAIQTIREAQE